jgi:hypothetical protein
MERKTRYEAPFDYQQGPLPLPAESSRPNPSSTGSGYLFLDDQVLERLGGRLRHL